MNTTFNHFSIPSRQFSINVNRVFPPREKISPAGSLRGEGGGIGSVQFYFLRDRFGKIHREAGIKVHYVHAGSHEKAVHVFILPDAV